MEESANSINRKDSNMVSRNAPIALVVGGSSFLGSHVIDHLVAKGIQVICIDDFSSGERINLEDATKNNRFHLINHSIADSQILENNMLRTLPRLDYAFFISAEELTEKYYTSGLVNFLKIVEKTKKGDKPRIALTSSINLYDSDLDSKDMTLKEAEAHFARMAKHYKLNARVVRYAHLFGPRMGFESKDPVTKLIQASLSDELNEQNSSLDFSTRNLYVDDAVHLLLKSVLSGATANKIYDGALLQPVKVSEIKQILLDPLWHESNNFNPTPLPPWPTPNLEKTSKELSWQPKTHMVKALKNTVLYFKKQDIPVPAIRKQEINDFSKRWSFKYYDEQNGTPETREREDKEFEEEKSNELKSPSSKAKRVNKAFSFIVILAIISFGLIYPIISFAIGGFAIVNQLKNSKQALEEGNFDQAKGDIQNAKNTLDETRGLLGSLAVLKRVGVFSNQITQFESLNDTMDEGIDGVYHAAEGSQALFQTTKIISGEDRSDPKPFYLKAQSELTVASQKIAKVQADLSSQQSSLALPGFIKSRVEDLSVKLGVYEDLVDKARAASFLLPQITAVDSKKSYLVLLQNNLELRPTGGFIGSYGKFDFENGRLTNIKVDDIYNLDGNLKDVIEPPAELKSDLLGAGKSWYLRDSNFDPDFPTSARQAEFFYKKEAGESVNGVITLDLGASSKLLDAIGGLDLPEYGEHVDGKNLFERSISHAEVNFFPGSQAKKNYLTSLESQLFNKIFYLSKQNWPAIIQAVGSSLEQKQILVYLEDPTLFSYLASENWTGLMPREPKDQPGVTNDFLAVNEANLGANKSNYYVTRSSNLDTTFGKEGQINHKLKIEYQNSSPSTVFPAGEYKDRMRIYLPFGTKINKVLWGETDITSQVTTFSDYGRAGYSMLLELMPKEQKALMVDYSLVKPINFQNNSSEYLLTVLKEPGTGADPFNWNLTYPINMAVSSDTQNAKAGTQEFNIATDMLTDKTFQITVKNK